MNEQNRQRKDFPAEVPVLRLWTDHGRTPVADTYGYAVYLGQSEPARKLPFEVLRNDTLVQAVCSADRIVIGAVFYPEAPALEAKGTYG